MSQLIGRRRLLWASIAAVVIAAVAVGIAVARRGPEPTVVNGRVTGSAQVRAGSQLHVDFGRVGTSIGDLWLLTAGPDPKVLLDRGQDWRLTPDCQGPGCEQLMVWRYDAVRAGTTSLTFQYCYRSRPPTCEGEQSRGPAAPVVLTVTVT